MDKRLAIIVGLIMAVVESGEKICEKIARKLAIDTRAVAAAIQVIVVLASVAIGSIVFSQLMTQANDIAQANNDTAAQNFISTVSNTGWASLNLVQISAIVLAATMILGLLMAWGRGGGGGGV